MHFLNTTYLNKYIYSPITSYHKIHSHTKIYIIYILLSANMYLIIDQRIIFIILLITTFFNLKKSIKLFSSRLIISNIYHLVSIVIWNQLIDQANTKKHFFIYTFTVPCTYQINPHDDHLKLNCYQIIYSVSKNVVGLVFAYMMYFNLISLLFMFTEYQVILEILINFLRNICPLIKTEYNNCVINLFLGCKSLQNLVISLVNTYTGRKIKGKYLIRYGRVNMMIIINRWYNHLFSSENIYCLILWNRNISYKSFTSF